VHFFTRPLAELETVEQVSPGQQLAEVEKEFRIAERAFIEACRRVSAYNATHKDIRSASFNGDQCVLLNAMSRNPELQQLEGARDRAQRKRNELLERRAELMKTLGLIR
jgi:hypothetical protein